MNLFEVRPLHKKSTKSQTIQVALVTEICKNIFAVSFDAFLSVASVDLQ